MIPSDPPERWQYKTRLSTELAADMDAIRRSIGLDRSDVPRMAALESVFAGVLTHFQGVFALRDVPETSSVIAELDDDFHERFARHLADMYVAGLRQRPGEKT